jgi:hypothetical protein
VNIEQKSYSYSANLIKTVNYAVFKMMEEDYVQSDICSKKEFIPELFHYVPSGLGKEIDIISVINLKSAEEAIARITTLAEENIEKDGLFALNDEHPIFDPLNNLHLYGMSSAFSSVYIKSISDPACLSNFRVLESTARVFMDYFMMDMAFKIGENRRIHSFHIPENYLATLKAEIYNSRRAYNTSLDNFLGAKILMERNFNEDIMH